MTDDEYNAVSIKATEIVNKTIFKAGDTLKTLIENNSNPAILYDKLLQSDLSDGQKVGDFILAEVDGDERVLLYVTILLTVTINRTQLDLGLVK